VAVVLGDVVMLLMMWLGIITIVILIAVIIVVNNNNNDYPVSIYNMRYTVGCRSLSVTCLNCERIDPVLARRLSLAYPTFFVYCLF